MKSTIAYGILSLIFFGFSTVQMPQGPHNGRIEKAGNLYFIEFKNLNQEIQTYLLDKTFKCIGNKDISCEIKFIYTDGTSYTKPLQPYGNEGFSSGIITSPFHSCRISFNVAGKIVSAKFENQHLLVQKKEMDKLK